MPNRKFKSYLITNIPETDWKKFKKWTVVHEYSNLNDALSSLIKLAGNNDLKSSISINRGEVVEQRT
tara:strand:+ start:372 stop:572 length:201 start_codon:yes stop_codon:yes gene_type:complete